MKATNTAQRMVIHMPVLDNDLYFATSNAHKHRELRAILGVPLTRIDIDLPEIQALDVTDVVRAKAIQAYEQTGKVVLVEDTGLGFAAWNGLPGALMRWFLQTVGNEGLCRLMAGEANRAAVAKTAIGMFDGREVMVCHGEVQGTIAHQPAGDNGFGWDAIFQPEGQGRAEVKTFAEMTAEEKNHISSRRLAAEALRRRSHP
ncbi:non-canonical purine NTP pyrophosphatase [Candidatus Entotheonella palauensis]|nr:non-canonical purine NTP pyrophosphatase [Candidatus Entotheonella palauensis]